MGRHGGDGGHGGHGGAWERGAIFAARIAQVAGAARAELSRAVQEVVGAVWPRTCWLCRAALDGRAGPTGAQRWARGAAMPSASGPDACDEHAFVARGLDGARCDRCARRLPHGVRDGERCRACRARAPRFARVLAVGEYREPLSLWVLALKHGGRADLARPLARAMAAAVTSGAGAGGAGFQAAGSSGAGSDARRPLLCPVPLHVTRRIERGYDQALLLARALGAELGLPVARPLARLRATAPQGVDGGRASRRANVAGAFGLTIGGLARRTLAGRSVWLVDDVLTSGATAQACADVLRRAGAASVTVVVVARAGARDRDAVAPREGGPAHDPLHEAGVPGRGAQRESGPDSG